MNVPRAIDPIASLFWSDQPDEAEPVGRVGSAENLENHFLWFVDKRMAALNLPELDSQRLFSQEQKDDLWKASGGRCGICHEVIPDGTAEYDHIRPWILGGRTELENGRPVHPRCHSRGLAAVDGQEAPIRDTASP